MQFRSRQKSMCILGLAVLCTLPAPAFSADKEIHGKPIAFGALCSPSDEAAYQQVYDWLQHIGRADPSTLYALGIIWSDAEASLLNRVTAALVLGDPEAAKLLADAADPSQPAPETLPAILRDMQRPLFFRANLALAYARALAQRRIYEEALEALQWMRPEDVVDPCAYLFYRAVAEHALMRQEEATRSLTRLLDDGVDVTDRHRTLAALMLFDMQSWREKDLGAIARKMGNIGRRLDLSRGGPQTQKMQKEVVARLDEIIKELENLSKGDVNGGACPDGGLPGAGPLGAPMPDSHIGRDPGPGNVDEKKLQNIARAWGKLPEKERARAMQELTRDLPPKYREVIEGYFRKLAQQPDRAR